ncbi:RAD55 family ATPase [Halostella pelagica]|uniref:RAD55 family ATPase n=1 Tax=Halostella pelagica TaxID=2583824 RepID=UPI0010806411|nr:HTR-like protein [Halostella pelagica]
MDRIPFGISRLDSMIHGGAPPGSVVLLAGDIGAGAREFLYTSAAINTLVEADPELFDLYYGSLHANSVVPGEVHYLSLTSDQSAILDEMAFTMDEDIVDAVSDDISFADLSPEYFQLSPVPTNWYAQQTQDIAALGERHDRRDVLDAMGDYLDENASGNLVVIDSVTDLVSAASEQMDWSSITLLMKGLKKASQQWGGLILLHVNVEALTDTQLGRLNDAADGTIRFEWESGGSERDRTMVVQQFRGVLSRLEEENIVRFETDIEDDGFNISNVRKIR